MCFGTNTATVKTPDKKPTAINQPMGDAPKPTGSLNNYGFGIMPPPDAPDLTDTLVRQRRAQQSAALVQGRGRRDSFLGGGWDEETVLGRSQVTR